MPWLKRNALGRPKRKYTDGVPREGFWEPGFAQNALHAPPDARVRVRRVYPVACAISRVAAAATPRTIEISKSPGEREIEILAAGAPADASWPGELGHDSEDVSADAPEWAARDGAVGFDVELRTQLNFAPLEGDVPGALAVLAAVAAAREDDGMWAQVAFTDLSDVLSPLAMRSAFEAAKAVKAAKGEGEVARLAAEMAPVYEERARMRLAGASVRGITLAANPQSAIDALNAAVGTIGVRGDSLVVCSYAARGLLDWMKSREVAHASSLAILESNAKMWHDVRIGIGRDMAPVLALSPAELGALAAVPGADALPVRGRRERVGGATEEVTGFELS